jgi:hypothetical protein
MSALISDPDPHNRNATDGHLFVCCACGKTSTTEFGFDAAGKSTASPGWDESCMLNEHEFPIAALVWNDDMTRVVEVLP